MLIDSTDGGGAASKLVALQIHVYFGNRCNRDGARRLLLCITADKDKRYRMVVTE